MATLKAVLGRQDEKLNLKNISLCVVLVVLLVSIAFGLLTVKPMFRETPEKNRVEAQAGEVRTSN